MISSDSATATRTCTATCAERLPGLAMTSPKFASEAARQPIRSDHSFEFYFNYPVAIYYEGTFVRRYLRIISPDHDDGICVFRATS